MTEASKLQRDRDLARHHATDTNRNRVRRDMASACREEILVLLLTYIDAAAAAANENTGMWFAGSQSGITPGFASRDDTEQRGARVPFGVGTAVAVLTLEWQRLIDGDRWNR